MTATDARLRLHRLQVERLDAVEAGLGANVLYMTDLENDIAASRVRLRRPRGHRDRELPRAAIGSQRGLTLRPAALGSAHCAATSRASGEVPGVQGLRPLGRRRVADARSWS